MFFLLKNPPICTEKLLTSLDSDSLIKFYWTRWILQGKYKKLFFLIKRWCQIWSTFTRKKHKSFFKRKLGDTEECGFSQWCLTKLIDWLIRQQKNLHDSYANTIIIHGNSHNVGGFLDTLIATIHGI